MSAQMIKPGDKASVFPADNSEEEGAGSIEDTNNNQINSSSKNKA